MFKKHNWVKYGSQDVVIEIRVRENYGRDLDFFRGNKSEFPRIKEILKLKYGFE